MTGFVVWGLCFFSLFVVVVVDDIRVRSQQRTNEDRGISKVSRPIPRLGYMKVFQFLLQVLFFSPLDPSFLLHPNSNRSTKPRPVRSLHFSIVEEKERIEEKWSRKRPWVERCSWLSSFLLTLTSWTTTKKRKFTESFGVEGHWMEVTKHKAIIQRSLDAGSGPKVKALFLLYFLVWIADPRAQPKQPSYLATSANPDPLLTWPLTAVNAPRSGISNPSPPTFHERKKVSNLRCVF